MKRVITQIFEQGEEIAVVLLYSHSLPTSFIRNRYVLFTLAQNYKAAFPPPLNTHIHWLMTVFSIDSFLRIITEGNHCLDKG